MMISVPRVKSCAKMTFATCCLLQFATKMKKGSLMASALFNWLFMRKCCHYDLANIKLILHFLAGNTINNQLGPQSELNIKPNGYDSMADIKEAIKNVWIEEQTINNHNWENNDWRVKHFNKIKNFHRFLRIGFSLNDSHWWHLFFHLQQNVLNHWQIQSF